MSYRPMSFSRSAPNNILVTLPKIQQYDCLNTDVQCHRWSRYVTRVRSPSPVSVRGEGILRPGPSGDNTDTAYCRRFCESTKYSQYIYPCSALVATRCCSWTAHNQVAPDTHDAIPRCSAPMGSRDRLSGHVASSHLGVQISRSAQGRLSNNGVVIRRVHGVGATARTAAVCSEA